MNTPTILTLKLLRKNGYEAAVVERRNWFAGPPHMRCSACNKNRVGKTIDLFGWADIVAVWGGKAPAPITGTLYIQTTSRRNRWSRLHKIINDRIARKVIESGNTIWLIHWHQPDGHGTRWVPEIEFIDRAALGKHKRGKVQPA